MPLEKRFEDKAYQVLIAQAPKACEKAKIGMLRIETGQRIDLDELRPAGRITAYVDAAAIAATEHTPGLQCDCGRGLTLSILDEAIDDVLIAALLVLETIVGARRLAGRRDLEHTEHARIHAGASDADGEFAPGQVGLDQDRLAEPSQKLICEFAQTGSIAHP